MSQGVLQMVAKMANFRQAARDCYGMAYDFRVQPFKESIRKRMAATGQGEIDTLLTFIEPAADGSRPAKESVLLFIAAALDVLEENSLPAPPAEGGERAFHGG